MFRYFSIIPLITVFLFSGCTHLVDRAKPDTHHSISSTSLQDAVQEHNQKFLRHPYSLTNGEGDSETIEHSYEDSLLNLQKQYTQYTQTLREENGTIQYLKHPLSMESLGFFEKQKDIPDMEQLLYSESTGSYQYIADISLSGGSQARLISVQVFFIMTDATLYFVEYDGKYFFLPSISYGQEDLSRVAEVKNIERITELQKQLQRNDVSLFDEKRFISFFRHDFQLPEKLIFTQSGNTYTMKFIERTPIVFTSTNLRKIDIFLENFDKPVYIEDTHTQSWLSPENQKIRNIFFDDYDEGQALWDALPNDKQRQYSQERMQEGLFSSDATYVEMPDHTTALYALEIPFDTIQVTKNSTKYPDTIDISHGYMYSDSASCGAGDGRYANIPNGSFRFEEMRVLLYRTWKDPKKWKNAGIKDISFEDSHVSYSDNDLTEIGTASGGETILGFRDKDHELLHAFYQYGYLDQSDKESCDSKSKDDSNCQSLLSYTEYISKTPVFFWKDPFGRKILFLSENTMVSSACAAKPVIYLYPKETTDITVMLDWKKKSLVSIPEYKNGWHIQANPHGDILHNNTWYPYLFWEDSIQYPRDPRGFIVRKEDLSVFFDEKLTFLGLNTKEIHDFKSFWIPVMNKKPYYRIHFLTNNDMQKYAPITVSPFPDSLQRVFMDWSGLDTSISIPEQVLVPFSRQGFSVIEWGGRMYESR